MIETTPQDLENQPGSGAGRPPQNGSCRTSFFDGPRNVRRLLVGFYLSLGLLLAAGFRVHGDAHFPWERWPQFYAVYGFVACVALVLAAKYILRPLVKRNEDYYD